MTTLNHGHIAAMRAVLRTWADDADAAGLVERARAMRDADGVIRHAWLAEQMIDRRRGGGNGD